MSPGTSLGEWGNGTEGQARPGIHGSEVVISVPSPWDGRHSLKDLLVQAGTERLLDKGPAANGEPARDNALGGLCMDREVSNDQVVIKGAT